MLMTSFLKVAVDDTKCRLKTPQENNVDVPLTHKDTTLDALQSVINAISYIVHQIF
jgi:hypothetical protein